MVRHKQNAAQRRDRGYSVIWPERGVPPMPSDGVHLQSWLPSVEKPAAGSQECKRKQKEGEITMMVPDLGPRLVDTSPPGNESAVSAGTEVGRWTRQLECALSSRRLQNYVDRTAHSTETESRLERQTPCRTGRETRRSGGLPCGKLET